MQETLEELENRYKKTKGSLRESVKQTLEHCYEVTGNLTVEELELIWYIRQSKCHVAYDYHLVAKKIYEAELSFNYLACTTDIVN